MMQNLQRYQISLFTLTPVHIGCGEDYDVGNSYMLEKYKMVQEDGIEKNKPFPYLCHFDPEAFFRSLEASQQDRFLQLLDAKNFIARAFRFYMEQRPKGRLISVSKQMYAEFKKTIQDIEKGGGRMAAGKQFQIARNSYHPHSSLPYIPGSSLKGAIRSALLNSWHRKQHHADCKENNAKKLEKAILGGQFQTDPFRLFKTSDLFGTNAMTRIYYADFAKRYHKIGAKEHNLAPMIEALSAVSNLASNLAGSIEIQNPAKAAHGPPAIHIEQELQNGNWVQRLHKESMKMLAKEEKTLKQMGLDCHPALYNYKKFTEKFGNVKHFVLRIGRYSGAEAMTIEGHRQIKIRTPGGGYETKAAPTGIWLASDSKRLSPAKAWPMGWVVVKLQKTAQ